MAGIHFHKTRLVLNKPMYTGMTILENSNVFYNHLKARYGPKCELIYTDTDSLLLKTEDVYKDMREDSWLYDMSNYPKDPLHDETKGSRQDERRVRRKGNGRSGGHQVKDVLDQESRQKKTSDTSRTLIDLIFVNNEHRIVKSGVVPFPLSDHYLVFCILKTGVLTKAHPRMFEYRSYKNFDAIQQEITHEDCKEALFGRKQYMHRMKILRSEGHEMYGMIMNKISISQVDTKRWISDDAVNTLAYGYKDIRWLEAVY